MKQKFKKLFSDRRGNVLAITAGAMPLLIGSAGLATDTIQWVTWKRQIQRSADSAAMAGVYAIVGGKAIGDCSNVAAATYAQPVAYDVKMNNHVGMTPTCSVVNPPSNGTGSGDSNAVKVTLSVQRELAFSSLFMSSPPTITASATATIVPSGKYCVVSLEDQSYAGIDATGTTVLNLGCGMITNSSPMSAAVATGNASVTATPIAAVGGIPASDNWGTGTVLQPFTLSQADPFADVEPPVPSGCQSFSGYDVGGNNKPGGVVDLTAQTGTVCIKEGGNGVLDIEGDVKLGSATYVLDATSLSMSNNSAKLSCNRCTIILTSSDPSKSAGSVSIQGGTVNMVAPNEGAYKGILFYQDRNADDLNAVKVNGNNQSVIEGGLYFPRAELTFNGTAGANTNCMQVVSKRVSFTGTSSITNSCPSDSGASAFDGKRVRLVA